jgi:catechol 2,3-dioxygenase-like lactoylglutathione lyase family enzyme
MSFTLTLAVSELSRTAAFYGDILLLPMEWLHLGGSAPSGLLLRQGDVTLLFRPTNVLAARHPPLFDSLDRHPRGLGVLLEFTIAPWRQVLRHLDRQQVPLLYELQDDEFDRREIWLHDPDGYLLVLQHEGAPP